MGWITMSSKRSHVYDPQSVQGHKRSKTCTMDDMYQRLYDMQLQLQHMQTLINAMAARIMRLEAVVEERRHGRPPSYIQ